MRASRTTPTMREFFSDKLSGRTNGTLFRRQPHPSHQLLESRIGSDGIVAGIGVDPRMHGPFLIGLLEPLECSVGIPQTLINHSDILRWNVPPSSQILEFLEYFLSLGPKARNAERVPQIHQFHDAAF